MPFAMITGGASLIGEGIVHVLVARGWDVAVTDINLEGAQQVAAGARGPGSTQAYKLDARERGDLAALVHDLASRHGRFDGLVNGAGGARGIGFARMPFVDMTPDYWLRMMDANLNTVLNVTHAVLPHMIAAKGGSIVSISAGRGLKGGKNAAIYSAAKAGIIAFSQSVAQEVGACGVRINTIAPGNAEARWKKSNDESRSPLGRNTSAEDVGKAVAFLLSEDASHITGSCLDLSGGTSLH
jgi:NAD(P)-dependent dehydrogenase (short-subunit alcohol dehydrogenase family)